MNELYQAFVAQVMERFEWAVKVLWTDSLTGELLYEIESKTELTPRTPHGFWDEWPAPMSPAGNPLFMFAGESALHLAAIWAEALTGGIAVGRLVALERPLEFCKALSASESESWVQAAIREISKHTKTQVDSIDRFREVDVLQRSIQNEYLQWLNKGNQNEIPLSGKPKHSLGSVLPDETSTLATWEATNELEGNSKHPTEQQIRDLYNDMKERFTVMKERRNRQYKGKAKAKGHGFEDFGFYRTADSWVAYEKVAGKNVWYSLKPSDVKKLQSFFPVKTLKK